MDLDTADRRTGAGSALAAYEVLAPFYDSFTSDFEHDVWLGELEAWVDGFGITGRRLLDVGCGTGKSFEPMIARGYAVTACDLSPAMVERARRRGNGAARVHVADMRRLPWTASFDVITCLDDGINYLLTEADLATALRSMLRALAPGGALLFDANTLSTYRSTFATEFEVFRDDLQFRWRGSEKRTFAESGTASATLVITDGQRRFESTHIERHWPVGTLRRLCAEAGFASTTFRGQVTGGRLKGAPDEGTHSKFVCLARKQAGTEEVTR